VTLTVVSAILLHLRYDTIRDVILTRARKPTWVSLIYRAETTTENCKMEKLKSKTENEFVQTSTLVRCGRRCEADVSVVTRRAPLLPSPHACRHVWQSYCRSSAEKQWWKQCSSMDRQFRPRGGRDTQCSDIDLLSNVACVRATCFVIARYRAVRMQSTLPEYWAVTDADSRFMSVRTHYPCLRAVFVSAEHL